jgi:hypothetical protein
MFFFLCAEQEYCLANLYLFKIFYIIKNFSKKYKPQKGIRFIILNYFICTNPIKKVLFLYYKNFAISSKYDISKSNAPELLIIS